MKPIAVFPGKASSMHLADHSGAPRVRRDVPEADLERPARPGPWPVGWPARGPGAIWIDVLGNLEVRKLS